MSQATVGFAITGQRKKGVRGLAEFNPNPELWNPAVVQGLLLDLILRINCKILSPLLYPEMPFLCILGLEGANAQCQYYGSKLTLRVPVPLPL